MTSYRKTIAIIGTLWVGLSFGSNLITDAVVREGCDEFYARNSASILEQFGPRLSRVERNDYRAFMNLLKLKADLEFRITTFERSLKTDLLAALRTPLQRYSDCRTSLSTSFGQSIQTVGPSKQQMSPCDKTYAVVVQQTLDTLKKTITPEDLKRCEDYSVLLKYKEDLAFAAAEFTKRTVSVTAARLRLPLASYLNCRDSLIRHNVGVIPQ